MGRDGPIIWRTPALSRVLPSPRHRGHIVGGIGPDLLTKSSDAAFEQALPCWGFLRVTTRRSTVRHLITRKPFYNQVN